MATALDLLDGSSTTSIDYIFIDTVNRTVSVNELESMFGVYLDRNVERKHFMIPRYIDDNIDLSKCRFFVNYVSVGGAPGQYICDDVALYDDETVTFSWLLSGNVFDKNTNGEVEFAIQATDVEGKSVFNTRPAIGNVYKTVNSGEKVEEEYPDGIIQTLKDADQGKIWLKILKNEPVDLVIPDGIETIVSTQIYEAPKSITGLYGNDLQSIPSSFAKKCVNLTVLDIPKATSIDMSAFYECENLITANTPMVTTIKQGAFNGCSNMTTINLSSVTSLGSGCFYGCNSLLTVDMPAVSSMLSNTFENCIGLVTVNAPIVVNIESCSFKGCSNLTTIDAPKCEVIGYMAFYNCSKLTNVNSPLVNNIGSSAFFNCSSLTTNYTDNTFGDCLTIPYATIIGSNAFDGCNGLTIVVLPELTSLMGKVFANCSQLNTVYAPKVTSLMNDIFSETTNLTTIYLGTLTSATSYSFRQSSSTSFVSNIENIVVGKGTNAPLYLQYSEKYSQETLHAIIDNLADLTGQTTKKFKVGEANLAKISDEYIAKLNAKNWDYE